MFLGKYRLCLPWIFPRIFWRNCSGAFRHAQTSKICGWGQPPLHALSVATGLPPARQSRYGGGAWPVRVEARWLDEIGRVIEPWLQQRGKSCSGACPHAQKCRLELRLRTAASTPSGSAIRIMGRHTFGVAQCRLRSSSNLIAGGTNR